MLQILVLDLSGQHLECNISCLYCTVLYSKITVVLTKGEYISNISISTTVQYSTVQYSTVLV